MTVATPSAAASLVGLTLQNGWKVTKLLVRANAATGGIFSHSYLAEKDGKQAFLKALDFSAAFDPGKNTVAILQAMTNAYANERDILDHCKAKRFSRVVVALDSGTVQVPGLDPMRGSVFYLIFELANGDVRQQVNSTKKLELVWKLRALKDVSLGLWQVHSEQIAHQDTKPSNVLLYNDERFRLSDFGRSSWRGRAVWYENEDVAGDRTYAPPELLYGFLDPNFSVRRRL
jgi:serine/threonine protein kinase